jgi:DNA repair protein RecN (Recombination protein N)
VAHGRTQTRVVRLSDEERIQEVARMSSGAAATTASEAAARELLKTGGESESRSSGESESPRRAKAK